MLSHWLALDAAGRAWLGGYALVLALLALLALHRLLLTAGAGRAEKRALPAAASAASGPADGGDRLPSVTVQLPLYNEACVAGRLLEAVAAIDWPHELLEVQVLDDSSDATRLIAARGVDRLRDAGIDAVHLHRDRRDGFKAGALAAGLERARGELIAVFDADFVPGADVLRRLVPSFAAPRVGLVQARWGHLNRGQSPLTALQAVLLDGHFLVEQQARAAAGHFFNFNGTAGIWRRAAITDAGGWQADTLTEDLDLSYRAQLRGWRFVFRPDVVVPAELPADVDSFKGQQRRWARGSAQTARKLLPALLRAPLPLRVKAEGALHLGGNCAYVLILLLALLTGPALACRPRHGWTQALALDLPFLLFATTALGCFYSRPLAAAGRTWRRWLLLPGVMALGIGMSVNNAAGVLAGLLGPRGTFRRTPKRGAAAAAEARYRPARSASAAIEIALAAWFAALMVWAWQQGLYLSLPFLALFEAGFLACGLLSLVPRRLTDRAASARSGGRTSPRTACASRSRSAPSP